MDKCDKFDFKKKPADNLEDEIAKELCRPTILVKPDPEHKITDLLNERGKTHGDFTEHAKISQQLKSYMSDLGGWNKLNACQREALDMIAHKIGRILAGDPDFRDHWDDIAGYAKLVADRCTK